MDYTPSKLWLSEPLKNKPNSKIESIEKPEMTHHKKCVEEKKAAKINIWDKISLHSIKCGNYEELYRGKSKYQHIEIVASKDIRMYLNNQLQFSSLDERIYHEAFVHIPMALTESHKRVLILGGGDGLALREVLKYSDVKYVDLFDIDEKVLYAAKHVPELVSLNKSSLYDRRVKSYAIDALEFLKMNSLTYDVIIIDFPDPTDAVLANLYTVEVFQTLYQCLTDDGILVCQSFSLDESPTLYWSIGLTMEQAGFYTKGYHTIIPSFDDWGFHLACKKPIPDKVKSISVPHKTLPKNVANLFLFNEEVLSYKRSAVVNTANHLRLHEIYAEEQW